MKRIQFLLILLSICSYGQNIVKGNIVNTNSNVPIPFTNIYIKNTSIGVVSNNEGLFEINIPQKYTKDTLVFSFMGFETYEVNIAKLTTAGSQIIKLKPSTINLNQVTINVKALSVNKIVKQAFANYYKNFPDKPFIEKGFLRYTEKTKTAYKWLVEAAIEVYDPGFNKPSKKIKLNIIEKRKSLDYRVLDTSMIYSFYLRFAKHISYRNSRIKSTNLSEIPKNDFRNAVSFTDDFKNNQASIFSTDNNKIRYYNQKNAIFDKQLLKTHTFKLDTILYNSNIIYKIKIMPKNPPAKLNRKVGDYELPFGWIYIRKKDYAIIKLDYVLLNSKKGELFSDISGTRIASHFIIKFIKIEGKMYPKYLSYLKPVVTNKLKTVLGKIKNGIEPNSEDFYYSKQEILFTKIITDSLKINKLLAKPWNDNLFSPHPYHATFWKNYNVLLESATEQKMRQDLEKKVELKEQFKQHN